MTAYKRINEPVWDAYLPHNGHRRR
ncbi:DUF3986 family protein [Escherichia sp. TWPC-MK]